MIHRVEKQRSIKINAVLNTLQTVMTMLFPLITYPYATRVLGAEQLGKYNFAASIVSYFTLLAGVGIATYAVREGTKFREDREKIQKFSTEIFSINVFSTAIAYILLFVSVLASEKLGGYWELIFLISIPILFTTLGRGWIYSIYENYLYITLRTIGFQLLSLILLFVMVKDRDDVLRYALVIVISGIGKDLLNIFDSRKYCKLRFSFHIKKEHLLPILLIFSTSISTSIYQNTDVTMLGFWATDYHVGLYSVSVKIYYIIKQMLAALLIVTIPRFSYYLGKNDTENYTKLFKKVLDMLLFVIFPIMIGLMMMSDEAVLIIAGKEYIEASFSLKILSFAIIFNLLAYMLGYGVLLPQKKENKLVIATVISAIVNVLLNCILIPRYYQNAAALTTLIAEIVSFIVCFIFAKDAVNLKKIIDKDTKTNMLGVVLGCIVIIAVCFVNNMYIKNNFWHIIFAVGASGIGYVIVNYLVKNPVLMHYVSVLKKRFIKNQ